MEQKRLVELLNLYPKDRVTLWETLRTKSPGGLHPVLVRSRDQRLPLFGFLLEDLPRGWRLLVPLDKFQILGVRKTARVMRVSCEEEASLERAQRAFAGKMNRVKGSILTGADENGIRALEEGIRPGSAEDIEGRPGEVFHAGSSQNSLGSNKGPGEP